MSPDYPVDEVPATPEYVLAVLRDWTPWTVNGEAYPTPSTPLHVWLSILLPCEPSPEQLRLGINLTWSADISEDEWGRFDWEGATVGDLCRLIAACGRRPVIRPWCSPVGECLPAGAFLTVRSLLAAAGADACGITPSTPLAPYHRWLAALNHTLGQFAPGRRPRFVIDNPSWVLLSSCLGMALGVLAIPVGAILMALGFKETAYAIVFASLANTIRTMVIMRITEKERIEPDNIRTFRDLAYALAGEQPRGRLTSSR